MRRNTEQMLYSTQALMASLQLGCDVERRRVYLFGAINEMSAYRFIHGFKVLDQDNGPIQVVLCSPGGSAGDGFAIYDTLRTAANPVVIEGLGCIASAAVPVLLAGSVRFISPETRVMVHNLSYDVEEGASLSTPVIHSLSKDAERLNQRYHEIIAHRTGASVKDVEKWCADETFFPADDAVKHGFADKVLETRPLPANFKEGMKEVSVAFGVEFAIEKAVAKVKRAKRKKGKK